MTPSRVTAGSAARRLRLALTLCERRRPGPELRADVLGRVDDELAAAAVHRDDGAVGNRQHGGAGADDRPEFPSRATGSHCARVGLPNASSTAATRAGSSSAASAGVRSAATSTPVGPVAAFAGAEHRPQHLIAHRA